MFCENLEGFIKNLKSCGYTVHSVPDGTAARELVLNLTAGASVGCGGSSTTVSLGLPDALRANGSSVFFHWESGYDPKLMGGILQAAAAADWYLCSVNAISRDGKIINTDGGGNRIAGCFWGPKRVILLIGKNKFAETLELAMKRAKNSACLKNAYRLSAQLGYRLPCVKLGYCIDCHSPDRICRITMIMEARPSHVEEMHLILIDEQLGY